jgi:hypothetical protein
MREANFKVEGALSVFCIVAKPIIIKPPGHTLPKQTSLVESEESCSDEAHNR